MTAKKNPRRRLGRKKKPKKVMTNEVSLKDNVKKSVDPKKAVEEEMYDEDEWTLNELIK